MDGLKLRYLGAAGWHLRTPFSSLLIDPYFTRLAAWRVLVGRAIPDREAIARHTPPADWILLTHAHYDHALDLPEAACITGAPVYSSPQGCDLLGILGVPEAQRRPIQDGDRLSLGDLRVEVYHSLHRRILGRAPFEGPLRPGIRPPLRARDYRMDQSFSFRIEGRGTRVLVLSGIDDEPPVEADVLLVGADASAGQLAVILETARPRLVLPNHWDDIFQPLGRPVHASIRPPRGALAFPRRINLQAWVRRVQALAPEAAVIIPARFQPYALPPSRSG